MPVALFVLGATMGSLSLKQLPEMKDILKVALVKFVLIPAGTLTFFCMTDLNLSMPLFCSVVMIQACSPPATNLILMVKTYGGDARSVSAMMLILYLISIMAMPVWIAVWLTLAR